MLFNFIKKKLLLLFLLFNFNGIHTQTECLNQSNLLMDAFPQELLQITDAINAGKKFPRKRFIFHGPPGNGKTALAQKFAEVINAVFKFNMGSSLVNTYQNSGSVTIDNIFNEAVEIAAQNKVVIFIDEVDAIAGKKKEKEYLLATQQLWQWLDRIKNNQNIFVILATNFYNELNPILKSRFNNGLNVIEILNPEYEVRKKIISFFCDNNEIKLNQSDIDKMTIDSDGLSIREIEDIIDSINVLPTSKDAKTTIMDKINNSISKQKKQINKLKLEEQNEEKWKTFRKFSALAQTTSSICHTVPVVMQICILLLAGYDYLFDKPITINT